VDNFDVLVLTIGDTDHMGDENINESVLAYKIVLFSSPAVKEVHIVLGGYDDDEREIWEIPVAKAYVRRWAHFAGIHTYQQAVAGHLHKWSIGLLAKCGALDDVDPGIVVRGPLSEL